MTARSTDKEDLHGLIIPATKASLSTITFRATASTNGRTTAAIVASGKTIKCTGTESSTGLTAASTKGNTLKTKKKGKVSSHGLTDADMKDLGKLESNTARAVLSTAMGSRKSASGSKVNACGGTTKMASVYTLKRKKQRIIDSLKYLESLNFNQIQNRGVLNLIEI